MSASGTAVLGHGGPRGMWMQGSGIRYPAKSFNTQKQIHIPHITWSAQEMQEYEIDNTNTICPLSVEFDAHNSAVGSTAVEHVVACALVMQRARVRSPVGTCFLGEVFQGFSSPVR